jgi:hypothetical protein
MGRADPVKQFVKMKNEKPPEARGLEGQSDGAASPLPQVMARRSADADEDDDDDEEADENMGAMWTRDAAGF